MFEITTEHNGQGKGVVGRTFRTMEDAEGFLCVMGWRPNPCWEGHWMKEESSRMFGSVCVGLMSDVTIGRVWHGSEVAVQA